MTTVERVLTQKVFQSEVMPSIETTNPSLGRVIAWADGHPVVWRVVTTRRSKAFGIGSCAYIGWAQRSMEPEAILERVRHLHEVTEVPSPVRPQDSIFVWRARFTLAHFRETGFTGKFFQQHDARYPRSCMTLDFTPDTFDEVLDRFCAFMDTSYTTRRVTVNGETVRTFLDDGTVLNTYHAVAERQ